jgi:hypothetical protein
LIEAGRLRCPAATAREIFIQTPNDADITGRRPDKLGALARKQKPQTKRPGQMSGPFA